MIDEKEIRNIIRQVVQRTLGLSRGPSLPSQTKPPPIGSDKQPPARMSRPLITERDILELPRGAEVRIPKGTILTPLAREHIMTREIRIVGTEEDIQPAGSEELSAPPAAEASAAPPERLVAIGADHGGFDLKQQLIAYLRELGYAVQDCGTHGTESVDYPDYAFAVAKLVADGRAARGIIVDGAGIGSCMAANKVPEVRAAMCYDLSTARNSREHNDANVLTLGGGMIGPQLAQQIVQTWLNTPFAGGRHQRRVDKIMDIERRFLRTR